MWTLESSKQEVQIQREEKGFVVQESWEGFLQETEETNFPGIGGIFLSN